MVSDGLWACVKQFFVYYFNKYLNRDSTAFENILDFYAGLSFAYNAIGDDGNARLYGQTYFFGNQNSEIGDPIGVSATKPILISLM